MTWSDKQGPVDLWSPVHFMGGVVLGACEVPWWAMLGGSIVFEILENTLAETKVVQDAVPEAGAETLINAVSDIFVNMTGWAGGRALVAAQLLPSRKNRGPTHVTRRHR